MNNCPKCNPKLRLTEEQRIEAGKLAHEILLAAASNPTKVVVDSEPFHISEYSKTWLVSVSYIVGERTLHVSVQIAAPGANPEAVCEVAEAAE